MRVVVAMSGGVDSSIAAALLVEAGHEVIGMTMALYDATASERKGRGGTCCSPAEIDLARWVCEQLDIPHYTVDERERFAQHVIDDFVREYAEGRTPNPCTRCNEHVKFGPLLMRARALGAERLITGHYARVVDGELWRAVDAAKDQSYFLFAMGRAALAHVEFPLGTWTKELVRAKARALGLPNADAPDSQELCFVPGGDHGEVIEARAAALGYAPERFAPGELVDAQGKVVGEHRGIHRLTVGQRRGIGIEAGAPRYVLRVLPEQGRALVGEVEALDVHEIVVDDFRRMVELDERVTIEAGVQVRHRGKPAPARIELDGSVARVQFSEPVRAVAPGQAAVVYDGERLLGGGWILSGGP